MSKESGVEEVIVFATGSGEKVDAAAEIMNRTVPSSFEELGVSQPHLHSADRSNVTPGRNSSGQAGRIRSSGGGARLFVW